MSGSGNEGGNAGEVRKGFFARFRRETVSETPAPPPQDTAPVAPPVADVAAEPAPVATGTVGDEGRLSRLRKVFSWGSDDDTRDAPEAVVDAIEASVPEVPAPPVQPVPEVISPPSSLPVPPPIPVVVAPLPVPEPVAPVATQPLKEDRFGRIKRALARTRKGLGRLFLGRKQIDDELLESLETHLLTADLGVEVTAEVIEALTDRVKRNELSNVEALQRALRELLVEILKPCEAPLSVEGKTPFVLMVVGVNGVGKTTTIGKLARQHLKGGRSVMLAAGDTFRAAAVEQLQIWGERNSVPVVAQHTGADSASVIYDAFESAKARHIGLLIADTAGRLHTKSNLMDELKKIRRVLGKLDPSAPHEVLLVLDAGTGQNAVNQLQQFHEAVGVTGIVLTKLDGTAKGGVIFALCRRFGIPVRYIGVGEGVDDLQPFRAEDFVDALLAADGQAEGQG